MNISIRQGHVLDRLKEIPDNSIDCIVTSSPYYGLRNYGAGEIVWDETVKCEHQWGETVPRQHETGGNRGVPEEWQRPSREAQEGSTAGNFCSKCNAWKGELGQEPSYKMFVKHLLQIAKELKRVLKPTGTMFWNLADSYSGSGGWNWNTSLYEKEQHLSMKHARANAYPSQALSAKTDIPKKSQMMIPERFAMGLIDEQGWIKRNTIVWYKCLGSSTPLYVKNKDYVFRSTPKDLYKIQDREQLYISGDNGWKKLVRLEKQEPRDLLTVHLRNGMRIEISPEHRFPMNDRTLKQAKDLKIGETLLHGSLPSTETKEQQDSIGTYATGYTVGLYLAEGSKTEQMIQFSLHRKETYLSDQIRDFASRYRGSFASYDYENTKQVHLSGKVPISVIDHYVVGYGAKLKHLSNYAWNENNEFLKGVLDGYLEGDGYFDKKNNRWRWSFALNREFEYDLRIIANRLGYNFRAKMSYASLNGKRFPTIQCELKKEKSDHPNNKDDYEIMRIEKTFGISYEIEVDGDHLFSLIDGTITHNSNGMPSSVDDRFTNKWEPIFFFTKNQDYFFDLDAVRKPLSQATIQRIMQPNIENQFQTGKVADFAEQTQTGDMKKTLLNMQKRQLSSMSNEQKRNWFEKKQSEYDGKYSGMDSKESEMYNSKYDPGQNSYSANIYTNQKRDEARLEAEELFPGDSKAQQEYINMIHDHGGNPSGANPGDVLKNDFTNSFFSDKAVLTAFMDFLYMERPELLADSLLEITTRSHPFAHFAVYPETLVEPLIKAGCPSEVCSKCGKPKMKIMVKNGKTYDANTFEEREPYASNRRLSDVVGVSETSTLRTNVIFGKDIIWKPSCKCNAEFTPGTVLDPFGGSGTTALVAKNLGRSAILIEAVPEYTEIMRKRLEMDEGETDTEFQEVVADIDDFEVDE